LSNSKFKVVITDYTPPRSFEWEKEILGKIGAKVEVHLCKSEDEVIKVGQDADSLLMMYMPTTRKIIESLKYLKVVGRYGIGVDAVDLKAATENGVIVVNVPDYCIEEVSDHAVALIVNSVRNIVYFANEVRQNRWLDPAGFDIKKIQDCILGLYGFGNISQTVTRKMKGFKMRILSFDPFVDPLLADELGVELVDFETLLKESDLLSVHCPLNDKTKKSISYNEFNIMKRSAHIINTSRGSVIDQEALYWALKQKIIAGACLDVLEEEPPSPCEPLLQLGNVVVTPHMAFYSNLIQAELSTKLANTVAAVLQGGWPKSIVNPQVKDKLRK